MVWSMGVGTWTIVLHIVVVPVISGYFVVQDVETAWQPTIDQTHETPKDQVLSPAAARAHAVTVTFPPTGQFGIGQTGINGNAQIPSPNRRPNPFLQRLPSATADQANSALFSSGSKGKTKQPTNTNQFQGVNTPPASSSFQGPNSYQTGSVQMPGHTAYDPGQPLHHQPPTMEGPVPSNRISYQPPPQISVHQLGHTPLSGQQGQTIPNTNQYHAQMSGQPMQGSYLGVPQMPGQQMPGQQMPGHQMPGQQMPGQHMPGQHMLGHQMPAQQMPGQQMPGQQMTGQQMPGQQMPVMHLPGMQMPGQPIPGQQIPGQQIPGQQSLGQSTVMQYQHMPPAKPHYTTHQDPYSYDPRNQNSNMYTPMTLNSPAGPVQTPAFNDPNSAKMYPADPYSTVQQTQQQQSPPQQYSYQQQQQQQSIPQGIPGPSGQYSQGYVDPNAAGIPNHMSPNQPYPGQYPPTNQHAYAPPPQDLTVPNPNQLSPNQHYPGQYSHTNPEAAYVLPPQEPTAPIPRIPGTAHQSVYGQQEPQVTTPSPASWGLAAVDFYGPPPPSVMPPFDYLPPPSGSGPFEVPPPPPPPGLGPFGYPHVSGGMSPYDYPSPIGAPAPYNYPQPPPFEGMPRSMHNQFLHHPVQANHPSTPTTTPAPTTPAVPVEVEMEGPMTTPAPVTTTSSLFNTLHTHDPHSPVNAIGAGYPRQPEYPASQYSYGQSQQPPSQHQNWFAPRPTAYPPQQQGIYPGQPQTAASPYQHQRSGGYSQQPASYPKPTNPAGYPPQQNPVVYAPQQNLAAYPSHPGQAGYPPPQQNPAAYPSQQNPAAYPSQHNPAAYPSQHNPAAYPSQHNPAAYPQQPAGYPAQQQHGSMYPPQQQHSRYPPQQMQSPNGYPQPQQYSGQPPYTPPQQQYPQRYPYGAKQPTPAVESKPAANTTQLEELIHQIHKVKSRTQSRAITPEQKRQWEIILRKLHQMYKAYVKQRKSTGTNRATG